MTIAESHPSSPSAAAEGVPAHVAIIMDGNGRWAQDRNLPRLAGHRAGTRNIRRVIRVLADHGVKYLTVYAFSTENWSRPPEEVNGLWRLLSRIIGKETRELHAEGVRIRQIGRRDRLSQRLQKAIASAEDLTKENTRMTLIVALDYGGRREIVDAVRRLMEEHARPGAIDEQSFARYLDTAGIPDPDLVIRTAGEMRLSNFLLWQSAYSEYYSTPTCWPDFDEAETLKALEVYKQRHRRFGGLGATTNGKKPFRNGRSP